MQQQHQSQSYQRQAPAHSIQQSPSLNSPVASQSGFGVQNPYSHHSNIQSPYLNNHNQFPPPQQHQQPQQSHPAQENQYYTAAPSPRSSNGATYYPPGELDRRTSGFSELTCTDSKDHMAAAATMQRPYPPMYHTPQSNSPASVTSPQNHGHEHGRPLYSQPTSGMTQPMYPYYSPLSQIQTPYGSHNQQAMTPSQMMSSGYNAPQLQHPQVSPHPSNMNTSPRIKSDPNSFAQTPLQHSSMVKQHATPSSAGNTPSQSLPPSTGPSAAPGPIPATTPLVVRQDNNGVQWIAFEYSRDRVKMEYTIRCDVESVDTGNLSQEFKQDNCVYPRACVPRDQYKGNRLTYETDCNQVGWALADLNACLRGKRGLIQRAVDSWRNSNQDPKLRSRRVRRQAKITNKNRNTSSVPPPSGGSMSVGLPGPGSMPGPGSRGPPTLPSAGSQMHHHHAQHDMSPTSQDPTPGRFLPTTSAPHLSYHNYSNYISA